MNKYCTIILLCVLACWTQNTFSQIYYQQDFEEGLGDWISIDNDGDTVSSGNSMIAVDLSLTQIGWDIYTEKTPNKCAISTSWYTPADSADDWLISPEIMIESGAFLQWEAKAFSKKYPDGYQVYLSTGGADIADFTTLLMEVDAEVNYWFPRGVDLRSYIGQKVRIAFRNNSYNMINLGIDNIKIFNVQNSDAAQAVEIKIPDFIDIETGAMVDFYIRNTGYNHLNTIDLTFQADGEEAHTETFSDLDLKYYEMQKMTFAVNWMPDSIGRKNFRCWVSNVNSKNTDENNSDDTVSCSPIIYDDVISQPWVTPLIEIFSSSTCPPCVGLNKTMKPLIEANKHKLTVIKYQMYFPGKGDPYYIPDNGNRSWFYGITGVPSMYYIGGIGSEATQEGIDKLTNGRRTFFDVKANYTITDRKIDVNAEIKRLSDIYDNTNTKVFIAVVENLTTGNATSNGETEFHYVTQKMLPNGKGTVLSFESEANTLNLSESYTFPDTAHVEEMDDLSVVVFLQDMDTKQVLASIWAVDNASSVENNSVNSNLELYPNPASDFLKLKYQSDGAQDVQISVYNSEGAEVLVINRNNQAEGIFCEDINTKSFVNGVYFIKLTAGTKTYTSQFLIIK